MQIMGIHSVALTQNRATNQNAFSVKTKSIGFQHAHGPKVSLDTKNVETTSIGKKHGLDLKTLFESYKAPVEQAVTNLYKSKDTSGAMTGWLNLGNDKTLVKEIDDYAASVKGKFNDVVVLGIGGSSLGGYTLLHGLKGSRWNGLSDNQRGGYPRFHFVENVDAEDISGLVKSLDPKKTLVNVITKSGTTLETMSSLMVFKQFFDDGLKEAGSVKDHIVMTTDPKNGVLRSIADREGYKTFSVHPDVGGRFSVFSAVGLVPAALCGVDIKELLHGVRDIDKKLQNPNIFQNPAAQNAVIHTEYYKKGKPISMIMPYSQLLKPMADWYVQLWAESLGKKVDKAGKDVFVGPTPLPAVGTVDQHSKSQLIVEGTNDKVITFVEVEQPANNLAVPSAPFKDEKSLDYMRGKPFHQLMSASLEGTRGSYSESERPNVTVKMPKLDAYGMGQLLHFFEVQTAIVGALFNIDPFNQPGVERAKVIAKEKLK